MNLETLHSPTKGFSHLTVTLLFQTSGFFIFGKSKKKSVIENQYCMKQTLRMICPPVAHSSVLLSVYLLFHLFRLSPVLSRLSFFLLFIAIYFFILQPLKLATYTFSTVSMVTVQVTRESSRPKSCRPKPESCRPIKSQVAQRNKY